ncbi:MAG: glycoside hydrolase family 99-like domain-containing protein [Aquabacterium sp.]|nr:glycoside hydrolase family 99-like domain-containing protein [Aquabacterium sp.]
MTHVYRRLACCFLLLLTSWSAMAQVDSKIGVYYFPGWRNDAPLAETDRPWERIQRFKEREPLLGWYDEGSDEVMRQHIDWMAEYGLQYVVFDWYWEDDNRVYLDHALSAYFKAPNRAKLPFSILWANHGKSPANLANWDRMVDFWVKFYTPRPEMLRVDGKPVVFIFLSRGLEAQAQKFGSSAAELLARAQVKAKAAGLPGFYFVAGAAGEETAVIKEAPRTGYSAVTMYNLHRPPFIPKLSHSYTELDEAYRAHWRAYETTSPVPVFFPMTSGWDKRPWGGTHEDSKHDQSLALASEFALHLAAGKTAMESGKLRPGQTTRWGMICCWNEFGEGSYIEPTRALGKVMVEQVRRVFGQGKLTTTKD